MGLLKARSMRTSYLCLVSVLQVRGCLGTGGKGKAEVAAPPPGCSLLWGAGCSVQPRRLAPPASPAPRGRREGAPLSTAAADVTCHRPQAGDLGEPVQEVTRWSRGTEGPRAQDAPASGRKRSLLSAAPSVWADWLRSPVAA